MSNDAANATNATDATNTTNATNAASAANATQATLTIDPTNTTDSTNPTNETKATNATNPTNPPQLTIDFTNDQPVFIGILDETGDWKEELKRQEMLDSASGAKGTVYQVVDSYRPFSMDLLISTNSTSNNKPEKLATIRLVPGLIAELENSENPANPGNPDDPNPLFGVGHTMCISSDLFQISQRRINTATDSAQAIIGNTYCIFAISENFGFQLDFDYKCSSGNLTKSIYIGVNPKVTWDYYLIMVLDHDRRRVSWNQPTTLPTGLEEFVTRVLGNPTAKFLQQFKINLPQSINFDEYGRPDYVKDAFEFKSHLMFSNETMRFIEKTCKTRYFRWGDLELFFARESLLEEKIGWPEELIKLWHGSRCPIQPSFSLKREEVLITAKLSFTNQPKQPLKIVDYLLDLSRERKPKPTFVQVPDMPSEKPIGSNGMPYGWKSPWKNDSKISSLLIHYN